MPGGSKDAVDSDTPCPSLDQLPSSALTAVHAALYSLPHPRDAAALRCTCRTIHDEVLLPEKLELSLPRPPEPSTMRSLGLFLRSPGAAHTALSISIHSIPEDEEEDCDVWSICEDLQEAGEKLAELSLPCSSIGCCLRAVRESLPYVTSLVLRVDSKTDIDAVEDMSVDNGSDSEAEEGEGNARIFSSQLVSLTLQAAPGIPPVCIFDYGGEMPLQMPLHQYPQLRHIVLIGPIVREEGEPLFELPADATVTIDPGLGDRPPMHWARSPVSYRRLADMPESAVPTWNEYKSEDAITLKKQLDSWVRELTAEGIRIKNASGRASVPNGVIEGFFSANYGCAGGYLCGAGIPGQPDRITPSFTHSIAEIILEDCMKFWDNPAALLGHDPF